MASEQDKAFASYMVSASIQIYTIFSYSVPWVGIILSVFATIALMKPRRRRKNLLIYIFKWQYLISIIFWLNMLFNDSQFTLRLFNYSLMQSVSDPICKLSNMLLRFFYCASPWMQVVIVTPMFNLKTRLIDMSYF